MCMCCYNMLGAALMKCYCNLFTICCPPTPTSSLSARLHAKQHNPLVQILLRWLILQSALIGMCHTYMQDFYFHL